MITDFRTLSDGAQIDTDLCIIGAGPAGITIAREFDGTAVRVCLIESGGFEPDDDTQALYQGKIVGLPYFDLDATRIRCFGGSSYHWTGWCAPLNDMDFVKRDWVPHSGWPISKSSLDPHYVKAQTICDLGSYQYDHNVWIRMGIEPPDLDHDKIVPRFWQYSPPTRFGPKYRSQLDASGNIQVYLHANVTNIQTNDSANTVSHLDVRSLDGRSGRITAKTVVLACGGLENPRLLLTSNTVAPEGVGNGYDLVGRYFMAHPHVHCADVMATDTAKLMNIFGKQRLSQVLFRPGLCPSDQLMREGKILNGSVRARYVPNAGVGAAAEIFRALEHGRVPDDLAAKLHDVVSDLDDVAAAAYRRLAEGKPVTSGIESVFLTAQGEQAPNPDSRVALIEDRDALGLNRIQLDWRTSEIDIHTVRTLVRAVGAELGRLGYGRVRLRDWLAEENLTWPPSLNGGNHHMGTTRMADDPKKGVVDKNGRVHSVDNLYIAGSSVFPTSGYANPTLTIVALALRLADHLKQKFS